MPRDSSRAGRARRKGPRRPARVTVPATFLLRVVLLASVAVAGSVWALVRYYTHPRAPMLVPSAAPSTVDAGAWDAGALEFEILPR